MLGPDLRLLFCAASSAPRKFYLSFGVFLAGGFDVVKTSAGIPSPRGYSDHLIETWNIDFLAAHVEMYLAPGYFARLYTTPMSSSGFPLKLPADN